MATLYEIDNAVLTAINNIYDKTNPETGEIIDASVIEDLKALDELQIERDKKIENISLYIKNLESDAEAIKGEADKQIDRAKRKKSRAESLRKYIANSLLTAGETKFETERVALSFRKSTTVNITDINALPEEFIKVKTETSADKSAIKKAIQGGAVIDGAALVTNQNLQIK